MPSRVMQTKPFTYRCEQGLNTLFNPDGHSFINDDCASYEGKIKTGEVQKTSFPMLSMDENGLTDMSLHHMLRISDKDEDSDDANEYYRLVVSTAAPVTEDFDMDKQTNVEIITKFPTNHSVKVVIPSITELFRADDDQAVKEVLTKELGEKRHKQPVPTQVIIPPSLCEYIIDARCGGAYELVCTVLAWMRENKISRGKQGGKLSKSAIHSYACDIVAFCAMQYCIWSCETDEGDEEFLTAKTLYDCAPKTMIIQEGMKARLKAYKKFALKDIDASDIIRDASDDEKEDVTPTDEKQEEEADSPPHTPAMGKNQKASSPRIPRKISNSALKKIVEAEVAKRMAALAPPVIPPQSKSNTQPTGPSVAAQANPLISQIGNTAGNQVGAAFLTVLSQMSDKLTASSSSSSKLAANSNFSTWPTRVQNAILALTSPDPSVPAQDPSPLLVELCRDTTGSRMASTLTDMYPDVDMAPDIAMLSGIKKGNFTMNQMFQHGTKVTGISPFSCPPMDAQVAKGTYHLTRAKIEAGEAVTHTLTEEDLKVITQQHFFVPTDQLEFLAVLDNYLHMLKICFTETSHIYVANSAFIESSKNMREQLKMYARGHSGNFYMSYIGHLHMKNARYVNSILRDPTKGRKESLGFDDMITSLAVTTFMNNYSLPMLKDSSSETATGTGGGAGSSSQHPGGGNNDTPSGGGNRKKRGNGDNAQGDGSSKRKKVINDNVSDTRCTSVNHPTFRKGAMKCADGGIKCPKTNGVENCQNWFNKGVCHENCPRAASHIRLRGAGLEKWKTYSSKVAEKAASLSEST